MIVIVVIPATEPELGDQDSIVGWDVTAAVIHVKNDRIENVWGNIF